MDCVSSAVHADCLARLAARLAPPAIEGKRDSGVHRCDMPYIFLSFFGASTRRDRRVASIFRSDPFLVWLGSTRISEPAGWKVAAPPTLSGFYEIIFGNVLSAGARAGRFYSV